MKLHKMNIPTEANVSACPGHLIAEVQGETVVLQLASGQYFGLNDVGSRIWCLIQSPTSLAALIEKLLVEYDVSRDRLQNDILRIVEEMLKAQLVEIHNDGLTGTGIPPASLTTTGK